MDHDKGNVVDKATRVEPIPSGHRSVTTLILPLELCEREASDFELWLLALFSTCFDGVHLRLVGWLGSTARVPLYHLHPLAFFLPALISSLSHYVSL